MDVADKTFSAPKTAFYSHEDAYPYLRNEDAHTDVSGCSDLDIRPSH